jgi:hypothetical protein
MSQADFSLPTRRSANSASWARGVAGPLFTATVLLGAGLVFLIQPMFAKMVLPLLGGGAGVWNVALVFFQGALLAGYVYANVLSKTLPLRWQVAGHVALLAIVAFTLPIGIAQGFGEAPTDGAPQLWLIGLFAASVGAPYAVVSATAPLMQSWFARTGRADAGNPYQLYIASNLGSLGALLAYPLLVEPLTGAMAQSFLWSGLYGVLAVCIALCGAMVLLSADPAVRITRVKPQTKINTQQALVWMALAFVPSALLVGATTHLSTDVAAAPLLWVAPLAIYLIAFSVAFADKSFLPVRAILFLHAIFIALALGLEFRPSSWTVSVPVTLGALFLGAFVCLRELYQRRPEAEHLTSFYVYLSLGGVAGGAFAALLAPVIFDGVWEYPLALIATLLVRPKVFEAQPRAAVIALLALIGFLAMLTADRLGLIDMLNIHALIAFALAVAAVLMAHRTRWLLVATGTAVAFGGTFLPGDHVIAKDRGFYGVAQVFDAKEDGFRVFQHGTTIHGLQSLDPARKHIPLGYYGPLTPIGQVFTRSNEAREIKTVAVLGLGAGAMACHSRPNQDWFMVEIDPIVVRMAKDPSLFTMVSDCTPNARVVVGDARIEIAKEPAGFYDLIFADAFSSDAVPTHLLTKEAIGVYLSRLSEDGILVMQISNRVLDLSGIVARTARAAGGEVLLGRYDPPAGQPVDRANLASKVIIVGRNKEALDIFRNQPGWREIEPDNGRPWTDDRTNIVEAMWARWFG